MKRYKVVVVDKSMGSYEEETFFIEYYDIKSIMMLISEEQEIVKIELVGLVLDDEDEEDIEEPTEHHLEDLKNDKPLN
tara:strand:- start:409 stop:642 length:234 start_codon:yes stop_codon:yes gene_type:complete